MNQSAASAASLDSIKFQAVIKSAASAASLHGGCASGQLDHVFFFFLIVGRARGRKIVKQMKEQLPFRIFYIGISVVRSEIGGSGSEKKLCTLLGPKS